MRYKAIYNTIRPFFDGDEVKHYTKRGNTLEALSEDLENEIFCHAYGTHGLLVGSIIDTKTCEVVRNFWYALD